MKNLTNLYPDIEPFDRGHLEVGDGHRIYFEQCGNPSGLPALFLHGGPGSGCTPQQRRFFDPARYRVILFDQRGCGRSTPRGCTRYNTTDLLLRDIELLRAHLGIERWLVVGGSWGASLAIAYGGKHLARVSGVLLRGVFLTGRRDLEWFFHESAALIPDAWHHYAAFAPKRHRRNLLHYYARQLAGNDLARAQAAAVEWARFEHMALQPDADPVGYAAPTASALEALVDKYRVQAHYLIRRCFLDEPVLLRLASQLQGRPVAILHGRLDLVCRAANAWQVHRTIFGSRLRLVAGGGHSPFQPEMAAAMVEALDAFARDGDFQAWGNPAPRASDRALGVG